MDKNLKPLPRFDIYVTILERGRYKTLRYFNVPALNLAGAQKKVLLDVEGDKREWVSVRGVRA